MGLVVIYFGFVVLVMSLPAVVYCSRLKVGEVLSELCCFCESLCREVYGLCVFLVFRAMIAEGEHVVKEWWEVAGFTVAAGRWLGKDYDVGRNEHA